jgi:hypothetical protein
MAYRLVPTREEDQQRVLRDVACSDEHHLTVSFACRLGQFPEYWALDAGTGNYLIRLMHEEMRPEFENYAERCAFRFGDAVFDVRFDNMFGDEMTVKPLGGAVIGDVAAFREELGRAFAAHGRYGNPEVPVEVVPEIRD